MVALVKLEVDLGAGHIAETVIADVVTEVGVKKEEDASVSPGKGHRKEIESLEEREVVIDLRGEKKRAEKNMTIVIGQEARIAPSVGKQILDQIKSHYPIVDLKQMKQSLQNCCTKIREKMIATNMRTQTVDQRIIPAGQDRGS